MKIVLIIGYNGACRREELMNMSVDNIEFKNAVIIVTIAKTKTYQPRVFVMSDKLWIELIKKYFKLRPHKIPHRRFMPKAIATCLKLPDSEFSLDMVLGAPALHIWPTQEVT